MICSVIMFVTRALRSDFPVHGRPHTFGLPTIYRCLEKKSYFEYSLQYFLPTYWYSLRWGAVASGKLDGSRLQVDWVLNILSFAILNILNVSNIFHDIAKDLKYVGYFYCCGYSAMWKLQVKFPMVNLGPRDKWDIKGKVKKRKIN